MAQLLHFRRYNYAFDSEAAQILVSAYDKAIGGLHDSGQPAAVREIIAKAIIDLSAAGERHPEKLCAGALANIGLPP